ncbi:hypothetical protein FRC01_004586 [Tulasnella sp. 417]|nr:hypothetical protein FRC01_004586 [Tulasnella sp. 417]
MAAVTQDGPHTLVEPLGVHQSKDVVDTSSLLSTFGEPTHGETISTGTPPTPEAPQPTNPPVALASPPNKSGPEAVALPLSSIAVTPCHCTSSEAIFQSNSASGDEKEKCSTSASDRTATNHSGLIVATQLSGTVRQGSLWQTPCVAIPSLPVAPDNSEPQTVDNALRLPGSSYNVAQTTRSPSAWTPTEARHSGDTLATIFGRGELWTVKNGLASPAPGANDLLQIPAAAQEHDIVTRDYSLSGARCNFATGPVPNKTPRKIATDGVDIVDPASWRGKPLEEIAAALRRRGAPTASHSISQATPLK